jgi:hypothetical protein
MNISLIGFRPFFSDFSGKLLPQLSARLSGYEILFDRRPLQSPKTDQTKQENAQFAGRAKAVPICRCPDLGKISATRLPRPHKNSPLRGA